VAWRGQRGGSTRGGMAGVSPVWHRCGGGLRQWHLYSAGVLLCVCIDSSSWQPAAMAVWLGEMMTANSVASSRHITTKLANGG